MACRKEQKVYLMENEVGLHKIGISINPTKRARGISCNSGLSTKVVREWHTIKDAVVVENYLHKIFKSFRKKGEWFTELDTSIVNTHLLCFDREIITSALGHNTEHMCDTIAKESFMRSCEEVHMDDVLTSRQISLLKFLNRKYEKDKRSSKLDYLPVDYYYINTNMFAWGGDLHNPISKICDYEKRWVWHK